MTRAANLHRLQAIDLQRDSRRARLVEVEAALRNHAAVESACVAKAEAEGRLNERQRIAREAEMAVKAQKEKIKVTEARLYSGSVKKPKELKDLQDDVEALKRHLATLEDRQLEAMLKVDTGEAKHQETGEALAAAETALALLTAELGLEKQELESAIATLEMEREAAEAPVPVEDRETYARLRKSKRGVAVSKLSGGACNACGVAPSTTRINDARNRDDLIRCGNCDRILFVIDDFRLSISEEP